MSLIKKFSIGLLVLALLLGTLGATPAPAKAQVANCTLYHYVRYGETLYSIGLYYGVSWVYLAQLNNITNPRQLFAGQRICVSTTPGIGNPPPGWSPTFSILSVSPGKTVTIRTYGFPVNDTYDVLMGTYGSLGIGGIKVNTVKTGAASETFTFNIPATLADHGRIAIRLQSITGSGYFAYNWFYNATSGGSQGGGSVPPGYYPTFRIAGVVRNTSVTIVTSNLPANDKFDVLMNYIGTRGVGGIYVTTINSGAGGSQTLTFNVPAALAGQYQIAIRLQSPVSGYFAYNWFYNATYP